MRQTGETAQREEHRRTREADRIPDRERYSIAFFLDLDCAGFADCRTDTPGAMRERIAILEAIIRQNGITVPKLPD